MDCDRLAQSGRADKTLLQADLYDPCFLLPLFLRYLSIATFPNRILISATAILIAYRAAFRILSDKAEELGGGFRRPFLFGSRADTAFRLTRVHANFFVHALLMLAKPEHRMYEVFWNCLLAKPAVDLGAVPDFMRTIFSIHEDHRIERQWMIKLCAETVNDTSDYLLLEKSRVFKYCLTMYSDPSIDSAAQIQILRLLVATTKIPRACHALTRFHAFPLWLFRHALGSKSTPSLSYFFQIIKQMLTAFEDAKEESPALPILKLLDSTFRKLHEETTFAEKEAPPMDV
ncbi:unnamed protein product [Dibothriocephalus latus]|uniref:URB1 C-terminal domain-containing protein n=1 Tax=Dibothriocephalus latus TaxID=60516 RepID=A0A3P6TND1_DIBLA|nr:unnamed protein product [Dibothriocephalus latus]